MSLNDLAIMHYYGIGTKQDDLQAFRWFSKAVAQGNTDAMNNLGLMYYEGKSIVVKNYYEAERLFRNAAEQGSPQGMSNLGLLYYEGKGLEQNYTQAYRWFNRATAKGNEEARRNRDLVAREMTSGQIALAQKMMLTK